MAPSKQIWSEALFKVHQSLGEMQFFIQLPEGSPCKDLRAVELVASPSPEKGTVGLRLNLHASRFCLDAYDTPDRLKKFFGQLLPERALPDLVSTSGVPTLVFYDMQHSLQDATCHETNRRRQPFGVDKARPEVLGILNQLTDKAGLPQEVADCFNGIMEQLENGLLDSNIIRAKHMINRASVPLATLQSAKAATRLM